MSNGDSLDGFVFPPFIPPAAARPADPPPPAPQASVTEPPAEPRATAAARPTLPWDVETPIVGEGADVPAQGAAAQAHTDEAEDEDLPWLERPAPRAAVESQPAVPAEEPAAARAADDDFPDWMAWDDRDADEARSGAEGVAAVEGLEDFVPVDELGSHFSPAPAVDWTEAEPVADAAAGIDDAPAAPELAFDEPSAAGIAEPEPSAAEPAAPAGQPDPFTAASVSEAEQPVPPPAGGPFADVAARLEDIARTLRERPDELLAGGATDPLALLVAGYVMGYRARGG